MAETAANRLVFKTMAYGLSASDYVLAGVVFLIFVTAVAALVYVGWRISKRKDRE